MNPSMYMENVEWNRTYDNRVSPPSLRMTRQRAARSRNSRFLSMEESFTSLSLLSLFLSPALSPSGGAGGSRLEKTCFFLRTMVACSRSISHSSQSFACCLANLSEKLTRVLSQALFLLRSSPTPLSVFHIHRRRNPARLPVSRQTLLLFFLLFSPSWTLYKPVYIGYLYSLTGT